MIKKHLSAFILIQIVMFLFVGCSNFQTPNAAQSVLSIYNLYIKEETSGVLELGMTEEKISEILNSYNTTLINTLQDNMTSAGLTVENSVLEEIINARKSALKTMLASCEITSIEEDSAVVTLKTSYFDEAALDKKAADDAIKKAKKSGYSDADELLKLATDYYTQNLIDGYLAVTPSEELKEIKVNCVLSKNIWFPEDMTDFGKELGLIISGQK